MAPSSNPPLATRTPPSYYVLVTLSAAAIFVVSMLVTILVLR
jgi:hypothetical protein